MKTRASQKQILKQADWESFRDTHLKWVIGEPETIFKIAWSDGYIAGSKRKKVKAKP